MPTLRAVSSGGKSFVQSEPADIQRNRFLRREEVAARLGVSYWTLIRMWKRGEGPTRRKLTPKIDGSLETDVEAYLDGLQAHLG
jgi:predicted DNA-binding transcriptional regulator AlpA